MLSHFSERILSALFDADFRRARRPRTWSRWGLVLLLAGSVGCESLSRHWSRESAHVDTPHATGDIPAIASVEDVLLPTTEEADETVPESAELETAAVIESPLADVLTEGSREEIQVVAAEVEDTSPAPATPAAEVAKYEVTLNQAIYTSLNGHPVIGLELERIQQSQADFLTTSLFPNPDLFTDAQLLPLTRPFTFKRQGGPPQSDVIVSYPIDWFLFGKRTAAMTSAKNGVQVTQHEFENMMRLRVVIAAQAFYNALETEGLLKVARQNLENIGKLEDITIKAVAANGRPAIEASRIRLDYVAAEQRLRTAQAAERTAVARLRAIMGGGVVPAKFVPVGDLDRKVADSILTVDEAMSLAQATRPDLKAIQWRIAKAGSDIDIEQRAARPSIAPAFGYTRQYQKKAIGFPDANSWSAGLTMSVPIYNRNQGNIAKATSLERQVRFEWSAAVLDLEAEIEQSIAELRAAEANSRSVATEQLQLAESVRDKITEAYGLGGRPLIDVLDAQRNYRETYALYISSRAEYWRALYRYYAAIGQQVDSNE